MQGLINSIGTLMPIVLRDPSELATPAGLRILAGVAVILAGIILFALAGSRKEQSAFLYRDCLRTACGGGCPVPCRDLIPYAAS